MPSHFSPADLAGTENRVQPNLLRPAEGSRVLSVENSRTLRWWWFTVSAGWATMKPAGEAEAGNAGVQPGQGIASCELIETMGSGSEPVTAPTPARKENPTGR